MGFSQLYYTSCEQGLSGHPGYQFTAATPGVRPEVMSDVEAMTSYDAPPSLASDSSPEQIARSPVNLAYQPGSTTVLANVVFVGNDYSRRFGNYFAHALVTEDVERDLGGVLPIELWGADLWARTTVAGTELPPLAVRPDDRVFDHRTVAAFLASHQGSRHLPALLTAVDLAIADRERKVVIVERDANSTAMWIAAVSYLLPAGVVRRMSFATYEHEPRYSRAHVVGTLPESSVDRQGFDTYHLFDLVADEVSPIAVHPLADQLAAAGVEAAAGVWDRARRLADGGEQRLDDWHPVVLAATGGDAGAAVVTLWLARHASRLGAPVLDRLGGGLDLSGCAPDTVLQLVEAARDVGALRFADHAERCWVDAFLDQGGTESTPRSETARTHAAAVLPRHLQHATPERVVTVLGWARRCDLRVDGEVLHQVGALAFGPALLANPADERSAQVLRAWPELAAGVVEHFAHVVHSSLDEVVAVLLTDTATALDVRDEPALALALVIADARQGRVPRTRALTSVLDNRPPDTVLLTALWPDSVWNHHEALILLRDVDPGLMGARPLLDWLDAALCAEGRDADTYDRLCTQVLQHPALDALPATTTKRVKTRFETSNKVDGVLGAGTSEMFRDRLDSLVRSYQRSKHPRQAQIIEMLLERTDVLSIERLAALIIRIDDFRGAYLDQARTKLGARTADPRAATDLLHLNWELMKLRKNSDVVRIHEEVEGFTLRELKSWRRSDLDETIALARGRNVPHMADWFALWLKENAGNSVVRFLRNRLSSRGTKP